MPTLNFQDILPDPNYGINDHGVGSSNIVYGPGFTSVQLSSETKVARNETNSGRLVTRTYGKHKWVVNITYNPMTREEFEPVYNFLLHRQSSLKPFFVSLPHLRQPRDATFAIYNGSNAIDTHGTHAAGLTNMLLDGFSAISGSPKPGDLFTVVDSSDALHTKLYRITRVETPDHYETAIPVQQVHSLPEQTPNETDVTRLYFTPALQRNLYSGASIKFYDPKIRVVMTDDIQEYSLNNDNLYSFSLKLEEAQK